MIATSHLSKPCVHCERGYFGHYETSNGVVCWNADRTALLKDDRGFYRQWEPAEESTPERVA